MVPKQPLLCVEVWAHESKGVGAADAGNGFNTMMRYQIAKHIAELPQLFHYVADLSRLMAAMQNDVPIVSDTIKATVDFANIGLEFAASFALLLFMNLEMGAVVMLIIPVYAYFFRRHGQLTARLNFEFRNKVGARANDDMAHAAHVVDVGMCMCMYMCVYVCVILGGDCIFRRNFLQRLCTHVNPGTLQLSIGMTDGVPGVIMV